METLIEHRPQVAAGRFAAWLDRALQSGRFRLAFLSCLLTVEFFLLVFKANAKLLWCDEWITHHVATLPTFGVFWKALQAGADAMPPLYHYAVWLASQLPFDKHITYRLPSILGFLLAALSMYWFVKKRFPASAAFAAVFLLLVSPFREYAIEARSYGLVVGCLSAAVACWQRIGERRRYVFLFALFLTLGIAFHHLAAVALPFFFFTELTWTYFAKRVRPGVWVSFVVAACPLPISIALLFRVQALFEKFFWSRPTWGRMFGAYYHYSGMETSLAVALVGCFLVAAGYSVYVSIKRSDPFPQGRSFSATELVLIGCFVLWPALMVMATKIKGSGFTERYSMGAVIGITLATVYLLRPYWGRARAAQILPILFGVVVLQGVTEGLTVRNSPPARTDPRWETLSAVSESQPGIPVVIGSPALYLEAVGYTPQKLEPRLMSVGDIEQCARLVQMDSAERSNLILKDFVKLRVEPLEKFEASNQRFILYSAAPADWMTLYSLEKHYQMTLLFTDFQHSIYLVQR